MSTPQNPDTLPFGRRNYILLAAGVAVLALGYLLLAADKEFIAPQQFSISLWVAPVVILAGYGLIGYGILARDSNAPKA